MDAFLVLLVLVVLAAALIPLDSTALSVAHVASTVAVCALFFLHGARISLASLARGVRQWRIHSGVFVMGFVIFPALGLAVLALSPALLPRPLGVAIFFLTTLPSTIQSSVAFVSVARGNVPAAVFATTAANLAGIVVTPLLVALLLGTSVTISPAGVTSIVLQIVLPFAAGLILHGLLGRLLARHPVVTSFADRGSVLVLVFAAIGSSVSAGLWHTIAPAALVVAGCLDVVMLALALTITWLAGRALRMSPADQIVLMLCGSNKGLANGVAMASVLLPATLAGVAVIPLTIYHLLQLVTCAFIARRWRVDHDQLATDPAPQDFVGIGTRPGVSRNPADGDRTALHSHIHRPQESKKNE